MSSVAPKMESAWNCLQPLEMATFLERHRVSPHLSLESTFADHLVEILRRSSDFVQAQAGVILLDNPKIKIQDRRRGTLTAVAAIGDASKMIVGSRIPVTQGLAGQAYLSGTSIAVGPGDEPDMIRDANTYPGIDQVTSAVAIPIRIEKDVCGALELVNRRDGGSFSQLERKLLEIFAGYISISIVNVLDGRQAQEIAKRDNLTGLFNDRYLHIALIEALELCQHNDEDLAVLFIDLDYFKRVNDTHGHLAGSQVLREVGLLLSRATEGLEAITARYGGDEFVSVVRGLDLAGAVDLAERIRTELMTETFCTKAGEIQPEPLFLTGITCSIGVATLKRHIGEMEDVDRNRTTILRLADAAMYVAKETGRNRTALAGELVRRRELATD
ncbi:MAG: sensor domain-containing diguanylate cyclase [Thermoanaerobaculia bacterium]|nr:sensor domain-containing diguanylate cyclase [Thermoanaerobaculia bacterium]